MPKTPTPKFKKGDIVRAAPDKVNGLCQEFKDEHGTGPFIVHGMAKNGRWFLRNMDGSRQLIKNLGDMSDCDGNSWHHSENYFEYDVFLNEARKAIVKKGKEKQT